MKNSILLAVLLVGAASAAADAAVIYLKDGTQLKGTIVGATARDVTIYTANGTQRVDTARILRVDYSEGEAAPAPAPTPAPAPAPPPPTRYRYRGYAPEAPASDEDRRQLFSIGMGLAAPLSRVELSGVGGGSSVNGDPGFRIDAQYLYYTTPRLGLGAEWSYFNRSSTDSQSLLSNAFSSVSGDSVLLMGVAKYTLADRGWTRPYVLAGAGAHHTSTTIDSTPNPGFAWSDTSTDETRRVVDDSIWGFAATARAGLDFGFTDPWLLSFEIGWTGLEGRTRRVTQGARSVGIGATSGPIDVLTVSGRWGWRF
ncbi:MAG TPA: outer membrane beta-barrel protein [Elusimicrobiota bacterium]|nr:outer membrane beta-barrel protein [Elusimicrobiota bacterium]